MGGLLTAPTPRERALKNVLITAFLLLITPQLLCTAVGGRAQMRTNITNVLTTDLNLFLVHGLELLLGRDQSLGCDPGTGLNSQRGQLQEHQEEEVTVISQ